MNRIIKFRAWDKKNKEMNYTDKATLHQGKAVKFNFMFPWRDNIFIDEWQLMQFTGLTDKNGKEIYEGDILGGTPNMHIMEVFMGKYGLCIRFTDLGHKYTVPLMDDLFDNFDVEVIGNIYENKELLK